MVSNPFSFIDKLNLNSLYPVAPRGKNKPYAMFERFKQEMNDPRILNEDRGLENLLPRERMEPSAMQPEITKPMDVVFDQGNISETARAMNAARAIHGIDLNRNALSPYQAGQLALQDRKLEQTGDIAMGKQSVSEGRLSDTEKRTRIAQIRESKTLSDAEKLKMIGDIETGHIDQRGGIESGHIGERGTEARRTQAEGADQAETLEGMRARHAAERLASTHAHDRSTPILPSQERVAKLTRAEEARNTHPEWARYIKIVPGGGYIVNHPKWGGLAGPTPEVYKAINDFIESAPDPIRAIGTGTPEVKSEEINISPNAAAKPKSRFQMSIRDSK